MENFESSHAAKLGVENLIASRVADRFQSLFEIKSFLVLGEVTADLRGMLSGFGAELREYGAGFYRVELISLGDGPFQNHSVARLVAM